MLSVALLLVVVVVGGVAGSVHDGSGGTEALSREECR